MSIEPARRDLVFRFLDDRLSAEEFITFENLLKHDPDFVKYFVRCLNIDDGLRDFDGWEVINEARPKIFGLERPSGTARFRMAFAAVAAAAVAILVFIWKRDEHPSIAEVANVSGAVTWVSRSGEELLPLEPSMNLPAGTITVEGEASSAELRLKDGSTISLAGDSELSIEDDKQKKLFLRRGAFTASVRPQPVNHPMLVRTSLAEVEVLGTTFALDSRPNETRLDVESGRVKLTRLVDGKSIQVESRQAAIASLEVKPEMKSNANEQVPKRWSRNYIAHPIDTDRGRWCPPESVLPGRLRAVSYLANRKKGGVPIVFYGVGATVTASETKGYVEVTSGSVLRMRYRCERPASITVFMSVRRPEGTFGGNFEVTLPIPASSVESTDWVSSTLSLDRLKPKFEKTYPTIIGSLVHTTLIHTGNVDAGLEVAELMIDEELPR